MSCSTLKRTGGTFAGGLLVGAAIVLACAASTGCQTDVAGQTMPSGYAHADDVEFYATGPEMKLSREAAALAAQRANQASVPQRTTASAPAAAASAPRRR